MIKDITIGQYVPGNSFVHKLDPRVKILISLIYIVDLFIVNSFKGYIFIVLFTIISILISKIQFSYIYKGLKPIFILVIITAVLNIFMTTGVNPPLFKWKFLVVYKEGLVMAAFMAVRLVFLIIGTSLLTLTTSPIELTDAIEKLLNPMKKIGVPAHELAMMMTIALRFIPTLMDETDKIMKAQMARGADFQSGNIIQRAKNLIPILVPLFISSFRRADELAMAMEARCYTGGEGRTRMKQLKLTNKDFTASVCVFALVCVSIFSRVWWH
ncbi:MULTISPECIES: energy-coupling factor transporter transmembrane component T family protein [Clostridium]|jgi:energy-coupling factor transport system permease protein|uniref:Energy-coupling factor transporter transmembrane protein EcfT n=4 Tax=Clostridium TaxID=1485 RepID=A0A162LEJ7_9CLOT|nr:MULTISPECIES: energy-coupling factor transporter transmembrane component T [Clostridium]AGY76135.1 energy-coupling factor transporter transmembrane protein EcfT [Clostridium autoethanogenum DSM 10061]ALU36297.1 ECF-type transporter transmembrane protein EcfT [Clostridium autoethanogenum DSM 10061]OAA85137.1 Energy-coupling factor transporter transmembrane protein EcfT [Clostridium ljungdahlii DSM 13528]OAA94842.1 Energy-coupling factor transporter transmembrane protein EcfT [Clostridium cosk